MNTFSAEEDEKIIRYIQEYGMNYAQVAELLPGKSARKIRERYQNYLKPPTPIIWSPQEDAILVEKYKEFGKKWVTISSFLPTKSPTSIKKRFFQIFKDEKTISTSLNQEEIEDIPLIEDISILDVIPITCDIQENLTNNDQQNGFSQSEADHDHSFDDFYTGSISDEMPVLLPRKIRNFDLIREIGNGSFGSVALAKNLDDNKNYCAKIIPMEKLRKTKKDDLIYREIEIMKRVNHPNIVKYYSHFLTPDNQYIIIITKYYENNLFDFICSNKATDSEKQQIVKGLIQAVCYLHRIGIAHLDIKIENIMLDGLVPVLCDFGFARYNVNGPAYVFETTFTYAAPEYYQKTKIDLFKMDIWALGITFYMLATCDGDFYQERDFEIIKERTLHSDLPIDTDDELQNLVARCLVKNPKQRPSIFDLINDDYLKVFF